jgi:hypothetical protein
VIIVAKRGKVGRIKIEIRFKEIQTKANIFGFFSLSQNSQKINCVPKAISQ